MPKRIKASFGSTFRYILAMTIMIIRIPRTIDPAMITTSFGNPNINPPFNSSGLFVSNASPGNLSLRKLLPPLHVSDALFVALDEHLSPLLYSFAVIAACAGATADSCQRQHNFARDVLPAGHADGPD